MTFENYERRSASADPQGNYDRRATSALPSDSQTEVDEADKSFGELQVSEYIVFLLALDTYMRYVEETTGLEPNDDVTHKGLRLLRMADTLHLETIGTFISGHLSSNPQQKMLAKALRLRPTADGASRRALQLRTVLSRGGTTTMRAVFETNKALQNVRAAISASMVDDADAALDKLAVITIRNTKARDWIDLAAKTAGSGVTPTPVAAVNQGGVSDEAHGLLKAKIKENGASATSQEGADARAHGDHILHKVQVEAQEVAKKTLETRGEPDVPPTKSEVVGIATAAAVAAMSDPETDQNVPEPLRGLDPEQRLAAMTDGRVLVAAGAGAGKSTTLVSRIKYLAQSKGVNPARILACSFNTKAADELKEKIAKSLGYDVRSTAGVQVGTMHVLFYKFIVGNKQMAGFGTPEEQAMLKPPRLIAPPKNGVKSVTPISLTAAIRGAWSECSPDALAALIGVSPEWFKGGPPKAKKAQLLINGWRGNDVTLAQAKVQGKNSKAEAQAAVWYEMYLGIKGDIPGWNPPCGPSKAIKKFTDKSRPGGERLGDLDDMIKVLRDILRRDPKAKKAIQGNIDHILVDECQDLNLVQHQVFDMMSEHISPDSTNKSIWMVGDDKQAIYQFRGGKPELFVGLDGKEGWKTRMIKTNYRCEPEIVDAANRLAAHNEGQIPMEARANPQKARGHASIEVNTPPDNTSAAIETIGKIRKDMDVEGAKAEDYAVLARTNAELNDFETACIINEIPYIRKGGKGFLEAPESKALLGYVDLAMGNDYEKMKKSLVATLMKPDRGLFLGPDDVERAVDEAIDDVSRKERVEKKSVSPAMLLEPRYVRILADRLKQPYRLKMINSAKDPKTGEWVYGKRVDELSQNLSGLRNNVTDLRSYIEVENKGTNELIDFVLDQMTSQVSGWDPEKRQQTSTRTTLREQITNDTALFSDGEEDAEEETEDPKGEVGEEGQMAIQKKKEEAERQGLGAVQFLYALAKPNSNDQTHNTDPSTAQGFVNKISRYAALAETLRIDPVKFAKEQERIADPGQRRSKPPAITLSTVHSVKGAEWPNVSVLMPKGIFPMERKPKPDEPPPDPEQETARIKAERNLAYVALTRAAVNLEVICPGDKGISPFVGEAGLSVGQNVPKLSTPDLKTASFDMDDYHVTETLMMFEEPEVEIYYAYDRGRS